MNGLLCWADKGACLYMLLGGWGEVSCSEVRQFASCVRRLFAVSISFLHRHL